MSTSNNKERICFAAIFDTVSPHAITVALRPVLHDSLRYCTQFDLKIPCKASANSLGMASAFTTSSCTSCKLFFCATTRTMGASRPPRMISAALFCSDVNSNAAQLENCSFIAWTVNPRRTADPCSTLKWETVWNQVVRHTCGKSTKITKIILDPIHRVLTFFSLLFSDDFFPHPLNSSSGPPLLQQPPKALPESCSSRRRSTFSKQPVTWPSDGAVGGGKFSLQN